MTARGSAGGGTRINWSVDVSVILARTTAATISAATVQATAATTAAPARGEALAAGGGTRESWVDVSGRCHVYVNMAVQPSSDALDVVGLVFLHNPSWWDGFNLPPLTRGDRSVASTAGLGTAGSSGGGGDGGGGGGGDGGDGNGDGDGGGSGGASGGTSVGGTSSGAGDATVQGDGQTFLAFHSTLDAGKISARVGGGGDDARAAAAREAAGARMMGIITADADADDDSDDGEGGYPRHVYHVSEIIIHVVHKRLLAPAGGHNRPGGSGGSGGDFRLPPDLFYPPHSKTVPLLGSVRARLIKQALDDAMWDAKRSFPYVFISSGGSSAPSPR
jgi:hypothetical protein